MTRGDRILVVVLTCVALVSTPIISAGSSGSAREAIIEAPGGSTVVDLSREARLEIRGRGSVLSVSVVGGEIAVAQADCPDQVCVRMGTARPGRPIVCAPNGVSVRLSGSEDGGFDAVNR